MNFDSNTSLGSCWLFRRKGQLDHYVITRVEKVALAFSRVEPKARFGAETTLKGFRVDPDNPVGCPCVAARHFVDDESESVPGPIRSESDGGSRGNSLARLNSSKDRQAPFPRDV